MDLRWFEICYVLSQKTPREAFLEAHMEPSPGSWQKSDAGRLWSLLPSSSACEAHPRKCLLKLGSRAPASFQQDSDRFCIHSWFKNHKKYREPIETWQVLCVQHTAVLKTLGSIGSWWRREELSPRRAAKRDELTNRGGARRTPHHHYGSKMVKTYYCIITSYYYYHIW